MEEHARLMEAAKGHFAAGDFPAASHVLREAVEAAPGSYETWRALGYALAGAGNPPDALSAFHKALELEPSDVDSLVGLAGVQLESGDVSGAVATLERGLGIKPNHARAKSSLVAALVKLGTMKVLSGDASGGGAALKRACELQPGLPSTVLPYVDHLIEVKDYKRALDVMDNARRASPQDPKIKELSATLATDPRFNRVRQEHGLM